MKTRLLIIILVVSGLLNMFLLQGLYVQTKKDEAVWSDSFQKFFNDLIVYRDILERNKSGDQERKLIEVFHMILNRHAVVAIYFSNSKTDEFSSGMLSFVNRLEKAVAKENIDLEKVITELNQLIFIHNDLGVETSLGKISFKEYLQELSIYINQAIEVEVPEG